MRSGARGAVLAVLLAYALVLQAFFGAAAQGGMVAARAGAGLGLCSTLGAGGDGAHDPADPRMPAGICATLCQAACAAGHDLPSGTAVLLPKRPAGDAATRPARLACFVPSSRGLIAEARGPPRPST